MIAYHSSILSRIYLGVGIVSISSTLYQNASHHTPFVVRVEMNGEFLAIIQTAIPKDIRL